MKNLPDKGCSSNLPNPPPWTAIISFQGLWYTECFNSERGGGLQLLFPVGVVCFTYMYSTPSWPSEPLEK